jgi:hypothetical protein
LYNVSASALRDVEESQIVHGGEYVNVVRPKLLLLRAQQSVVQLLGFRVAALRVVNASQNALRVEYVEGAIGSNQQGPHLQG